MRLPLVTLLALALLTGCAGIPYEKPEDKITIQKDLSVKSDDIVTMSQVVWCFHPYGDMTPCHPKQALAVLTRSKLILARYSSQHYEPIVQTMASEVMCAHLQASKDTSPNFYLFTKGYLLQIWPVKPDNQPDLEKKKLMIDIMVQEGKRSFVGPEGNFVKDSGRVNETMAVIPNTAIPYISREEVMQIINPCMDKR